jgi:4-hydroxy-tetrahydrodipicolinate reductase
MLFLVLGKGKTGSLVAEVARERGHGVRVLDLAENRGAASITAPTLAGVDAVIDFTNAESAVQNIRAVLSLGGKIVVGTTGWYAQLDELRAKTGRGALVYGTNFSVGVQKFFRLTEELAKMEGYTFSVAETHHTTKLDAPSGTAITLKEILSAAHPGMEIPVTSHREGDAHGEHVVTAKSDVDTIELRHDAASRRGFALGAVRAAEWLAHQTKPGIWDFREIFDHL